MRKLVRPLSIVLAFVLCFTLVTIPAYASSLSAEEEEKKRRGAEYNEEIADSWAGELLSNSNYGKFIAYSSNWYSNLSTVEVLARLIYGENSLSTTGQVAVAQVIMNRVAANSSEFGIGFWNVATSGDNFSTIKGDANSTHNARDPRNQNPNDDGTIDNSGSVISNTWRYATFLACLMLTTTDYDEWEIIAGHPITTQLFFCSYSMAKSEERFENEEGTDKLQYRMGNGMEYVKDVYVIGYGTYTDASDLLNIPGINASQHNIFFNIE